MTKYQSEKAEITANQKLVFEVLSSPAKIKTLIDNAGFAEKMSGFNTTNDTIVLSAPGVGNITFLLGESEPFSSVVYVTQNSPLKMELLIHLDKISDETTELQLKLTADLPPVIKMMLGTKVQEALDKLAKYIALAFNK